MPTTRAGGAEPPPEPRSAPAARGAPASSNNLFSVVGLIALGAVFVIVAFAGGSDSSDDEVQTVGLAERSAAGGDGRPLLQRRRGRRGVLGRRKRRQGGRDEEDEQHEGEDADADMPSVDVEGVGIESIDENGDFPTQAEMDAQAAAARRGMRPAAAVGAAGGGDGGGAAASSPGGVRLSGVDGGVNVAELSPAARQRVAQAAVARAAAMDIMTFTATGEYQLSEEAPDGPTGWKWPPPPPYPATFDASHSTSRVLFDRTHSRLGAVDQFEFRNVRLSTGGDGGLVIHAYGLKDLTHDDDKGLAGAPLADGEPGAEAARRDWAYWNATYTVDEATGRAVPQPPPTQAPPLANEGSFINHATPPGDAAGILGDWSRATWSGINLVHDSAPLASCAPAGTGTGKPAPIYYYLRPLRCHNVYHAVSDGLAQFYRMMVEMGNAPQPLMRADGSGLGDPSLGADPEATEASGVGGGRSGYGQRRPNILIVGPLDASNAPPSDPWDHDAPMFMHFARQLFDDVIQYKDAGRLNNLCAVDLRIGLTNTLQEITVEHYLEYMAIGGLRPAIEIIMARNGVKYEPLADRTRGSSNRAAVVAATGYQPRYGPVPDLDLTHYNPPPRPAAPATGSSGGARPAFQPPIKLAPFVWDNPLAGSRGGGGKRPFNAPVWPPRVLLQVRRGARVRNFREEDVGYVVTAFGKVGVPVEVLAFTEATTPRDQLAAFASGDIIIGFHGAGLSLGVFARPGALLVQLVPSGLDPEDSQFFHRLAVLAQMGYYEWQERDVDHFLQWKYGSGLHKPVVGFRNPGYKPRDIRVFVISTLMAWVQSSAAYYA